MWGKRRGRSGAWKLSAIKYQKTASDFLSHTSTLSLTSHVTPSGFWQSKPWCHPPLFFPSCPIPSFPHTETRSCFFFLIPCLWVKVSRRGICLQCSAMTQSLYQMTVSIDLPVWPPALLDFTYLSPHNLPLPFLPTSLPSENSQRHIHTSFSKHVAFINCHHSCTFWWEV